MKKIMKNQMKAGALTGQLYQPMLRFSPTAWAKLLYFRDKTDNEVGGFGITDDDLLYVTDFITVKQNVTAVSVKFDDNAVSEFFDKQVDLGRKPEQFARLWLHTHPGSMSEPSATDEETFQRVFGKCQWAVMFILAEDNKAYAGLSFNVGPCSHIEIPVRVDYRHEFGPSEKEKWDIEYSSNVTVEEWIADCRDDEQTPDLANYVLPYDFIEELEEMSLAERQVILDELAARPDLWDEGEVMFI